MLWVSYRNHVPLICVLREVAVSSYYPVVNPAEQFLRLRLSCNLLNCLHLTAVGTFQQSKSAI